MRRLLLLGSVALAVAAPASLNAQDGFLFRQPTVTLGVHGGLAVPSAHDDIFDFFTRELTLERSDFASASFGAEIGVRIASHFDVVLGVSHAKASQPSEFLHWEDTDEQPIEQVTTFKRTPVTLSARYFPLDRGRDVGRYAWIPAAVLPYVGAGVGMLWYDLLQAGDFVDFTTLEIFRDRLRSSGSTVTAQVFAGAQWWPLAHVGLTTEGRYAWANATLENGFSEFGSIDLNGFQWTAGIAARF
jgi:hypothetical protein